MTRTRRVFTAAAIVVFGPVAISMATPDSAPAWIRSVERGLLIAEMVLIGLSTLVAFFTPGRLLDRAVEWVSGSEQQPADRSVGIAILRDAEGGDSR